MRLLRTRIDMARELAPFAGACALVFALLPIGGGILWGEYFAALATVVAIAVAAVLLPWRRFPPVSHVVLPIAFLAATALLRDAAGGANGRVGVLTLLPVVWVALHGRRRDLALVLVAVGAFFALPSLLIGAPAYPRSGLGSSVSFGVVSGIVGATVNSLVTAIRAQAREGEQRRNELATVAREREHLLAQLERLAMTDPLTGLGNRRAWHAWLEEALADGARDGAAVALAVLDLDRFKDFNDAHGHVGGDRLLIAAAAAWTARLRPGDQLARIGGEEFGVLLRCGAENAAGVLERLREDTPLGQTVSAGLALWDGVEASAELVHRADVALYAAKRAGRDRLVHAHGGGIAVRPGP
jgi:diguanylate cyclase (GGDEF)-like protein